MEISQVNIKNTTADTKFKLVNDIMRLLNVREKNEAMTDDWLLFISTSNFKITAGEIYLAFKMALSREILDDKGREIDLFPELSNNATGKVISAYLKFKNENNQYQLSKDRLKALKTPEKKITPEEILEIRETLLKSIFEEIKTTGYSSDAWHLFLDLEKDKKLIVTPEEKLKLYKEQLRIYDVEEKARIRNRYGIIDSKPFLRDLAGKITGKTPVESVSNICRSIIASKHLKKFVTDFETFKNHIKSN